LEFRREVPGLLVEIEAEAKEGEGGKVFAGDGFDEQAGEFTVLEKEIIRPFEGGGNTGEGMDGIGHGEGTEERKDGKAVGGDFEEKGYPEAEGFFGDPNFPLATVAGGLDFGGEDGGGRRELSPEKVLSGSAGKKKGYAAVEGGGSGEVDMGDLERIGRGGGFRGRNCRRS
jgi:hypothetical protein